MFFVSVRECVFVDASIRLFKDIFGTCFEELKSLNGRLSHDLTSVTTHILSASYIPGLNSASDFPASKIKENANVK